MTQCPICKQNGFKGKSGLNIHIGQKHKNYELFLHKLKKKYGIQILNFINDKKPQYINATKDEFIKAIMPTILIKLELEFKYYYIIKLLILTMI